MAIKRQSLGKGLDALMGDYKIVDEGQGFGFVAETGAELKIKHMPVEFLQRGQYQPRRDHDPTRLEELARSIKQQGIMQPIVVRKINGDNYEIIAGERRWLAAQRAGLHTVPAIVREVDDRSAIAMALIENIQREDLNPLEESLALVRLQEEFNLTQQQIADTLGKSRTTIANLIRLASLEPGVQEALGRKDLDIGHAKCLLALTGQQQLEAATQVVDRSLSVRQTELLVKRLKNRDTKTPTQAAYQTDIDRLQRDLSERFGAQVNIDHTKAGRGKLVFRYNSLDELDGIIAKLK